MEKVLCFSGVSGSGKTTAVEKMIRELNNRKIGGITTTGDFNNGKRQNFWVRDVTTNNNVLLAQRDLVATTIQGAFGFTQAGLQFGNNCLYKALSTQVEVLFIDEIGPLELRGEGWYPSLQIMMKTEIADVVFTSRPTTVAQICDTFFPNRDVQIIEVNRI
ncbi:nucleoside-triphosphatase [Candidatus Uabimicrobium sp. HlEnr_7]|uniref:nucleoside-triphosphatase n=1 Tax=Candidatus Uabimicrobium helgolandensis TaxID=3095367 RepID=UPI0035582BF0